MNEPTPSATSLLAVVAPRRERTADAEAAPGFADELAAAETVDKPASSTEADRSAGDESAAPRDDDGRAERATDKAAPASRADADGETPPPAEEAEAELLVVSVAYETLVVETPPDAQLPETAVTQVAVDASASSTEITSLAPADEAPTASVTAIDEESPITTVGAVEATTDLSTGPSPADDSPDAPLDLAAQSASVETSSAADPSDTEAAAIAAQSTESLDRRKGGETVPATGTTGEGPQSATDGPSPEAADAASHSLDEAEAPEPPKTPAPVTATAAVADSIETGEDAPTESSPTSRVESSGDTGSRRGDALERIDSAARTTPNERGGVDPGRFVTRVARAIDFAQQRGGGPIEMRLSPPELGSLQVRIEVRDGVMTASLETETPAARNALLENLPALRDRLAEQQIRVEKFDVDVRDESGRGDGDQRATDDRPEDSGDQRRRERAPEPTPEPAEVGSTASQSIAIGASDEGVNLVA